ncbi:MAG: periplasmic heavy metal sensor [Ignavibacteriales bacterium]|nr:periplasmic heavy metal sensor [Ignavibacteriales bacterium]
MKKVILILAVTIVTFLSTNITAQQHKRGKDLPGAKHLLKELNLTDQQKDDFDKLRSEHQKKAIDLKAEIQKLHVEMKDQLREKNINEEQILSLSKKVSELQAQLKESAIKMWLQSYKLLDDKQKEMWKQQGPMLGERMGMMRQKVKAHMMEKGMPDCCDPMED